MRKLALFTCVLCGFGLFMLGCGSSSSDPDYIVLQEDTDAAVAIARLFTGMEGVHDTAHYNPLGDFEKSFVNHSGRTLVGNKLLADTWAKTASMALALDILPVEGECGGFKSITGTDNAMDGTYTVVYDDFDDCFETTNGKYKYSWKDYGDDTGYEHATYYNYLVVDSDTGDLVMKLDGYVYLDWDDSGDYPTETIRTSINAEDQDGKSGFSNTVIDMTFGSPVADETHAVNGVLKVDGRVARIETISDILVGSGEDPFDGQFTLNGDGKVRVTFLEESQVRVEIDGDENGVYEFDETHDIGYWMDLSGISFDM